MERLAVYRIHDGKSDRVCGAKNLEDACWLTVQLNDAVKDDPKIGYYVDVDQSDENLTIL